MDRISLKLEKLARESGMNDFMERDGVPFGVRLMKPSLWHRPPLMEMAGKDVIVRVPEVPTLWDLKLQYLYKETPLGMLYYYVPLPRDLIGFTKDLLAANNAKASVVEWNENK